MPKKLPISMMKETVVIPPEHRIPKKAGAWQNHVREFAKQHQTTFFKALTMPGCKESYHSAKK